MKMLISAVMFLIANAVGLALAMFFLDGFHIDPVSFVFAVVILSVLLIVIAPILNRVSRKNLPALQGGAALVTTFIGLWVTSLFLSGMQIGGVSNWLVGTLIVWLGALVCGIFLPTILFKKHFSKHH